MRIGLFEFNEMCDCNEGVILSNETLVFQILSEIRDKAKASTVGSQREGVIHFLSPASVDQNPQSTEIITRRQGINHCTFYLSSLHTRLSKWNNMVYCNVTLTKTYPCQIVNLRYDKILNMKLILYASVTRVGIKSFPDFIYFKFQKNVQDYFVCCPLQVMLYFLLKVNQPTFIVSIY